MPTSVTMPLENITKNPKYRRENVDKYMVHVIIRYKINFNNNLLENILKILVSMHASSDHHIVVMKYQTQQFNKHLKPNHLER